MDKIFSKYFTHIISLLIVFGSTSLCTTYFTDETLYPKWAATILIICFISIIGITKKTSFHKYFSKELFEYDMVFLSAIQCIILYLQENCLVPKIVEYSFGSFDNVAGFVSYICLTLPLGVNIFNKGERATRVALLVCKTITIFAILYSESRIGIICCAIFLIMIACRHYDMNIRKIILVVLASSTLLTCFLFFAMKQDSSKGRLFIATRTIELIKEKLIFGYGHNGFCKNYMEAQSEFFKNNPDSEYAIYADNVHHPMSDVLLITFEFGMVGLCVFIGYVSLFFKLCSKQNSNVAFKIICLFLILLTWVLFSYPLRYPFTWIAIVYSLYNILPSNIKCKKTIYTCTQILAVVLAILCFHLMIIDRNWRLAQNYYDDGKMKKSVSQYNQLFQDKKSDYKYLYDYSFVLYNVGQKEKALQVALECSNYISDYNLCLLLGYIYRDMNHYKMAIDIFEKAHNMCPSRVVPLFEQYIIYRTTQDNENRSKMANTIKNYPIKVMSPKVYNILNELEFLEAAYNNSK